jgi:hypothetical protein
MKKLSAHFENGTTYIFMTDKDGETEVAWDEEDEIDRTVQFNLRKGKYSRKNKE